MPGIEDIKKLREITSAAFLDCREALREARGDFDGALSILKKKGKVRAEKKGSREVGPGIIQSYVHPGGQVGVLLDLRCETDFVVRNEEFKKLAHELSLQVASMAPLWVEKDDVPPDVLSEEEDRAKTELSSLGKTGEVLERAVAGKLQDFFRRVCLLEQPHIKNQDETVADLINSAIAKLGENIKINRFIRFEI